MNRKLVRRSFLGRVLGAAALLAAGAGAAASVRPPRRGTCSDTDTGPSADPPNRWYGDRDSGAGSDPLGPVPRFLTDRDAGPNADRIAVRNIGRCGKKARPGRR